MSDLRIVFMGTPEFAVASLRALLESGFSVVGVVTSPDKPAGRGQQLSQSAVKKYALEKGLKLLQPEKLKAQEFMEALKELKADLQIVVAFRMLPQEVWSMPPQGTYNLHASLLPAYRGAAPINWAVMNGEKETGVTTFRLRHEIDTGSILFREKVPIDETTTAGELHNTLMQVGAKLIVKTVKEIEQSAAGKTTLAFYEQDNSKVSHAPKIFRDTCRVDWNKPGRLIYDQVRGLSPYPAAFTEIEDGGGKRLSLKIFVAAFEEKEHENANGSLFTDNKTFIGVYCKGGVLFINDLQLEGKRRMGAGEFLRGFTIKAGAMLV